MKRGRLIRIGAVGLLALGLLAVFIYFVLSPPSGQVADGRCREVKVHIQAHGGGEPLFLSPEAIVEELTHHGLVLKGRPLDSIDLRAIEQTLSALSVYEQVEAFLSPTSSSVQIRLREKHPLFIVQDRTGTSHYITQDRGTITMHRGFATYLPVVSGDLDLKYATTDVYDLMTALRRDSDLMDYFGQVYVDSDEGIVLIPRIGRTRVIIGKTSDWAEKLRKWRIFASTVLPRRGTDAFAYVNLDYAGQVVARDRHGVQGFGRDEEGELIRLDAPAIPPTSSATMPSPAPTAPASTSAKPSPKPTASPGKKAEPKPSTKKPAQASSTPKKPTASPKPPSKPTKGSATSKPTPNQPKKK